MAFQAISVDVLSDDDGRGDGERGYRVEEFDLDSLSEFGRRKVESGGEDGAPSEVILVEDGPTPLKKPTTENEPWIVPDTPVTPASEPVIVRCSRDLPDGIGAEEKPDKFEGIKRFICLESEDEESGVPSGQGTIQGVVESSGGADGIKGDIYEDSPCDGDILSGIGASPIVDLVEDSPLHRKFQPLNPASTIPLNECRDYADEFSLEDIVGTNGASERCLPEDAVKSIGDEKIARKKDLKEEKIRQREEKKRKRQEEKLAKEALKAEAAKSKKLLQEQKRWETGKFALKCIIAEIDAKVVENGSIGGHLLTRFAEKGLSFRITSNPIKGSILWKMNVPEELSQLSLMGSEVQYVLMIFEAEEFCKLSSNGALLEHVRRVQSSYPSFTVCYLTNMLMSFVNKWEQNQYKNKTNTEFSVRPPVEEVLSKLTTHFRRVHSRQCMDEAEVADHVVGLTCSLASCQHRKKITRLSVNANGSHVSKDFIDRRLVKGNVWLRALVAIPKVQPRFAVAIWKKYPTMRSLLNVYMDPMKSVHEKEFLLQDLPVEGQIGGERRLGETCSKRVFRILMARNGAISTDDAENGADFFSP
ncbi:crossover junction endonuclease EME1B-like [Wolffia australiana]